MRGERARIAERVRELLGVAPTERQRGFRWDPGRRGAAAVGMAALVTVAVTVWWLMTSRPQAVSVIADAPSAVSASATGVPSSMPSSVSSLTAGPSAAPPSTPAAVVVDVAGKVRRPGIYRLPAGSRVYDAIRAAGGARPGVDLVSLNLAALVQDGQQLVLGRPGVSPSVPAGAPVGLGSTGPSSVVAPVNLNTATLEQLDALPGVGPVLAQHVVDWRLQHGRFASVNQLNEVSGIGEVKFAELRGLVSV